MCRGMDCPLRVFPWEFWLFSASDQVNNVELIELAVRKFPPLPSGDNFLLIANWSQIGVDPYQCAGFF
jgi:hypothetical protein